MYWRKGWNLCRHEDSPVLCFFWHPLSSSSSFGACWYDTEVCFVLVFPCLKAFMTIFKWTCEKKEKLGCWINVWMKIRFLELFSVVMFSNSRRTHLFQAQSASVLFSTLSQGPTWSHSSKEYGKRHRDRERERKMEKIQISTMERTKTAEKQKCATHSKTYWGEKKTCCLSPKTVEKNEQFIVAPPGQNKAAFSGH